MEIRIIIKNYSEKTFFMKNKGIFLIIKRINYKRQKKSEKMNMNLNII